MLAFGPRRCGRACLAPADQSGGWRNGRGLCWRGSGFQLMRCRRSPSAAMCDKRPPILPRRGLASSLVEAFVLLTLIWRPVWVRRSAIGVSIGRFWTKHCHESDQLASQGQCLRVLLQISKLNRNIIVSSFDDRRAYLANAIRSAT